MDYLDCAKQIIKKINSQGYEAYIIGGAVRDYLLNMPLNDIDLTTNMPLAELESFFDVSLTGASYLGVTINFNGYSFEITEFRKDIAYFDNRHPVVEKALTLEEDSKRRDFTINAIGMDSNGVLYDYHNGTLDLKNKVIRAIGDPDTRFKEDSLRILRALYYASKLDFVIDELTLNAIINNRRLLANLSCARLYSYTFLLAKYKNGKGLEYIKKYNLFEYILEYKKLLDIYDSSLSESDLALLYYLRYHEFASFFKADDKKKCQTLKELEDANYSNYVLFKYNKTIKDYFTVLNAYGYDIIALEKRVDTLVIKNTSELALDVKEITSMFIGKMKGIMLERIIDSILNNKLENSKEAILTYIKEHLYE